MRMFDPIAVESAMLKIEDDARQAIGHAGADGVSARFMLACSRAISMAMLMEIERGSKLYDVMLGMSPAIANALGTILGYAGLDDGMKERAVEIFAGHVADQAKLRMKAMREGALGGSVASINMIEGGRA